MDTQGSVNSLGHFWKIGELSFHWDGSSTSLVVHLEGLGVRPSHVVQVPELLNPQQSTEDLIKCFRALCLSAVQRVSMVPTTVDALFYAPDLQRLVVEKEE